MVQLKKPAHILLCRLVVFIQLDGLAVVLPGFVDVFEHLREYTSQIEAYGFGV